MNELKPCPFCGGDAMLMHASFCGYDSQWVECANRTKCGAKVEPATDVPEVAIKAWNIRAERTCYNKKDDYRHYFKGYYFVCSECGWSIANDGNAGLEMACGMIRICPSCGAKVVD